MPSLRVHLPDEAATARLGVDLAMAVRPGDTLCLSGGLGAGKTTLARALIRQLAGDDNHEVPSPTYTLCQHYELEVPVRHFDFYRLADESELDELGLEEGMAETLSIVEWPDIACGRLPLSRVEITLDFSGGGREATIGSPDIRSPALQRIQRSLAIRDLLAAEWNAGARRTFLQGDASTRRYETAEFAGHKRLVMDAPRQADGPPVQDGRPYSQIAHLAEDVRPFIAVAGQLRKHGFAAPAIHASRVSQGLLLTEYLGEGRITDAAGKPIGDRYVKAAQLLADLHAIEWPDRFRFQDENGTWFEHVLPRYDRQAFMIEVGLFTDWYIPSELDPDMPRHELQTFVDIWSALIGKVEHSMPSLVLRDYHSPNLIWRGGKAYPSAIGLIDFQDAVIGPRAYDVASLAQDARVDMPTSLETEILEAYIERAGPQPEFVADRFRQDFAILAAQRATKILGIFVRLNIRDGKRDYMGNLPRLRRYLERDLEYEPLEALAEWCRRNKVFHG